MIKVKTGETVTNKEKMETEDQQRVCPPVGSFHLLSPVPTGLRSVFKSSPGWRYIGTLEPLEWFRVLQATDGALSGKLRSVNLPDTHTHSVHRHKHSPPVAKFKQLSQFKEFYLHIPSRHRD